MYLLNSVKLIKINGSTIEDQVHNHTQYIRTDANKS